MINDSAKTILCYGDSNTWGYNPETDGRYARSIRWPGALQRLLGEEYEVVSEGLCGRALVAEDPKKPHRTGITHLQAVVESADPVDLMIIMLGTNDIKNTYNLSAQQIAEHLQQTIDLIRNPKLEIAQVPRILILCPPPVGQPASGRLDERMVRGVPISKELPDFYKKVAEKNKCDFIDVGRQVSFGTVDGYHLTSEGHVKLAQLLHTWIQKM